MQSRIAKDLVLDALLVIVWTRNPSSPVRVHSDHGKQYTSHDWTVFLQAHDLEGSTSRQGNCHDHAVTESFTRLP